MKVVQRLAILLAAPALLTPSLATGQNPAKLRIVNIRVGQGDATLILGPADATGKRVSVLMDAGDIPSGGNYDGGRIVGAVLHKHNQPSSHYTCSGLL